MANLFDLDAGSMVQALAMAKASVKKDIVAWQEYAARLEAENQQLRDMLADSNANLEAKNYELQSVKMQLAVKSAGRAGASARILAVEAEAKACPDFESAHTLLHPDPNLVSPNGMQWNKAKQIYNDVTMEELKKMGVKDPENYIDVAVPK